MEISQGMLNFMMYFFSALALVAAFGILYEKFTPYREIQLICAGNTAASISFFGAMVGFAMPVACVIAHAVSIQDMLLWSSIACVAQLVTFLIARNLLVKDIKAQIESGNNAAATLLATLSICVGIVNAASMTY